jgi:UDP-GlcNAc:undecaprenyl-phosphate GlcNAc-1-phosphate transferase
MSYLLTFVISFLACAAFLPIVLKFAHANGWYDSTGGRKIHSGNVPRLGGVGMVLAFFVTALLVYAVYNSLGKLPSPGLRFWLLMAIGFGFHLLGLADDFMDLRGRLKFVIQILLGLAVIALGYGFTVIELPFPPFELKLGLLGPVLTLLWIVGLCNAMNLIDGLDGLAGGVAFIGCAVWAVLFYMQAQYLPAIVATAAGGAILGFLFFNFPPAGIFMGDSGSLFLGFILAVLPLLGSARTQGETGLLQAITISLVPLLDTLAAILRRWRHGVSFFTGDRFHIHHKLLNLGFSIRQVLVIVYGLCMILGAAVLLTIYTGEALGFAFMILSWALVGGFFLVLHYLKENKVRLIRRGEVPEEGAPRRDAFNKEPEE